MSQRVAYVLREAFDYSYQGTAYVLKLTEANIRHLDSRARKHISDGRRTTVTGAERRRLLVAFIDAVQKGDAAALEELFATGIVSYSDGGGVLRAARVPVSGRARVAKFIAVIASHFWTGVTFAWIEANGQPAVLISRNGEAVSLVTIKRVCPRHRQIMETSTMDSKETIKWEDGKSYPLIKVEISSASSDFNRAGNGSKHATMRRQL